MTSAQVVKTLVTTLSDCIPIKFKQPLLKVKWGCHQDF